MHDDVSVIGFGRDELHLLLCGLESGAEYQADEGEVELADELLALVERIQARVAVSEAIARGLPGESDPDRIEAGRAAARAAVFGAIARGLRGEPDPGEVAP